MKLHSFLENLIVSSEEFDLWQKIFKIFLSGEECGVCCFKFVMKEEIDLLSSI